MAATKIPVRSTRKSNRVRPPARGGRMGLASFAYQMPTRASSPAVEVGRVDAYRIRHARGLDQHWLA